VSYYAGLRPSQGLAFPTDTAVYPIEHEAQGQYGNRRQRREIDWRETQDLGKGWLNARTPTQLLTVSSRPAKHKLAVVESGASSPSVENLLGTRIEQLILIDSEGRLFEGRDMAAGAKAVLTPSTRPAVASQWAQAYNGNRLQRPPGMAGNSYSMFGIRRYNNIYFGQNQDIDSPTLHTSILERALVELTDSGHPVLSQPRSYVAIVERSPEMSFGLKTVKEESSFHVILGRW
jgi:hypothetical protein